jgi:hypothetical protein
MYTVETVGGKYMNGLEECKRKKVRPDPNLSGQTIHQKGR